MTVSVEIAEFLTKKRNRKAARRIARSRRVVYRKTVEAAMRAEMFGARSKIIAMLAARFRGPAQRSSTRLVVKVPKVFSIIEDPVAAVRVIEEFAKSVRHHRYRSIDIDQRNLATYDLAAMSLLDIVATEVAVQQKHRKRLLNFTGQYPKDPGIKLFVQSMGIVKHLKIEHEIRKADPTKLRLFDRRNRHYIVSADPTKADVKSKVVMGFVDHFNACLSDHRRELTPAARAKLCDYIGEILGNAEDHAGFVDWTVQGYLDNSLETPICEIAIFNFGKSIAETLKELPSDHYTSEQINGYVMMHAGAQYFGPSWRLSDLLTLVALQGHVSSKNTNEDDTRGQGTGDLIDFFQRVHKECAEHSPVKAKMAILSGGTHILFDGKYTMRETEKRGRVIAFNQQNDLFVKPDKRYVQSLGSLHFPGTVISIRFPLSAASTVTLGDQHEEPTRDN